MIETLVIEKVNLGLLEKQRKEAAEFLLENDIQCSALWGIINMLDFWSDKRREEKCQQ